MPVIPIVGEPGSGKTTFVLNEIDDLKRPAIAYTFKPQNYDSVECEVYRIFDDFLSMGLQSANTIMIIDEAETVIPKNEPTAKHTTKGFISNPMLELFAGAREYNNLIYPIFHDLRDLPLWLLKYCNPGGIIRFNTQERLDIQIQRFKDFTGVVESLEKSPQIGKHKFRFISLRSN